MANRKVAAALPCPSAGQLADMAVSLRAEAEVETERSLRHHHADEDFSAGIAADRARSLRKAARLVDEAARMLDGG